MSRLTDNWHVKYTVHEKIEVVVLEALEDTNGPEAVSESYSLEEYVLLRGDSAVLSVLLNV